MGCEAPKKFRMEDFSFNKNMLLRNSSAGACSSRIYYCRSASEGIPFQWEMQPGTPKDPPREEAIPPLSPPPAVLSLGLPKPCINEEPPVNKPLSKLRLAKYFWTKKSKKTRLLISKCGFRAKRNEDQNCVQDDFFEFSCSDYKSVTASPTRDSSSDSPSSLSLSLSNSFSRESSPLQSPSWDPPNGAHVSCSPWNITSIFVRLSKSVEK